MTSDRYCSARLPFCHLRGDLLQLTPSAHLHLPALYNGGHHVLVLDATGAATAGFDALDDLDAGRVGDLTEDDVLSVQPAGYDSGDKELGAVSGLSNESAGCISLRGNKS